MGVAHLTIALLGPFEAAVDGKRVTWFQSDKARALLAYLAVEAATPHTRHALAGLLWSEFDDAHALHSLSQALCSLRQVLHDHAALPPCLDIAPHTIQFNAAADCRRSEALRQYHLCRRLLASELGVEPAAATNDLYQRIRDDVQDC